MRASADHLKQICDELIDRVCEQGECDLVRDLAAPLPLIVIGDMLGVPPEDRSDLLRWSDDLLGSLGGSPEHIQQLPTLHIIPLGNGGLNAWPYCASG